MKFGIADSSFSIASNRVGSFVLQNKTRLNATGKNGCYCRCRCCCQMAAKQRLHNVVLAFNDGESDKALLVLTG
jgi:hypothetical protein